jgi:transcriptional/translational regulatory protein YebC/TACO1
VVEDEDGIFLLRISVVPAFRNIHERMARNFSASSSVSPLYDRTQRRAKRHRLNKLLEKIEDDEDVQNVFHNKVE